MHDLLILGGGPAGYLAAERAAHEGFQTVLFETRALGGVCLNEGCIPSKTLLHSAKIYDYSNGYGAKYGVTCDNARINYDAVITRKNKVVRTLVAGISSRLKTVGVQIVTEHAVIQGRIEGGFAVEAGGLRYEGKKLLLCTGSQVLVPRIDGLDAQLQDGFVLTSREILDLREIPERLVVVGGGVIGLEMSSLFRSLGAKVTVIEMLDKIAGPADAEVSALLQKDLEKRGVTFLLSAKVTSFANGVVRYEQDGVERTLETDKVLLSIGRKPSTDGFGLETLGIVLERGAVKTDDQMKTSVPGVFASGDCNGKSMLAHTAYRESDVAINVMAGQKDTMDYGCVPYVIYTNPEVAGIGETLESARTRGLSAREITLSMRFSGRYLAENEGGGGICKLIVGEDDRLLGVHMIGNPASEIISTASLSLSRALTLDAFKKTVFPHPSVAEILRECAFA